MFLNIFFFAVFIYGAIVMGCAFLFSRIGGTFLEKFITISGTVAGPILGLFTLGAFVPWANYKVSFENKDVFCGTFHSIKLFASFFVYLFLSYNNRIGERLSLYVFYKFALK